MNKEDRQKVAGELVKVARELSGGVGYELYAKGADRIAHQTIVIKDTANKLAKATRENKPLRTRKKLIKELEKWLKASQTELEYLKKDADNLEGYKTASRKANKVAMHPATIKKLVREVDPQLANDLSSKIIWGRGVVKSLNRLGINDIKGLPFQGYDVYNVVFKNGDNEMMRGKKVRELIYNLLQKRGLTASRKASRGVDNTHILKELGKTVKHLNRVDWDDISFNDLEWGIESLTEDIDRVEKLVKGWASGGHYLFKPLWGTVSDLKEVYDDATFTHGPMPAEYIDGDRAKELMTRDLQNDFKKLYKEMSNMQAM